MDNFDSPRRSASPLQVWDILTILTLLVTVCLVGYFAFIFFNPYTPLNLLPPPPTPFQFPTATITPLSLPPTWTASPTLEPTQTSTLAPTFTPLASPTPFSLLPPTSTPTVTPTPKAPFSATVNAVESVIIPHLQGFACNWQGVGGTVDDSNNSPIIGIVVRLMGSYNGKVVQYTTVSGVSPDYGRSGFEFALGTVPIASKGLLYVQLLDQAGLPLSDKVYLDTFNDCKKNLVLVRFRKNR
jgi:hypothetical protein